MTYCLLNSMPWSHSVRQMALMMLVFCGYFSICSQNAVRAQDEKTVYDRVLPSISVIMPETNGQYTSSGTGWVLDAERRLILTNDHVTEGATDCLVYFPLFEDDQVVTEGDRNLIPSRAIHGKVVDSDPTTDLSIVQVDKLPDTAIALPIAQRSATPGQTVHSIAGSSMGSQSLWTYSSGHVRQLVHGKLANDGEARLLESDMATNQGNSGGPVFNDQGQVVAVVEGHRTDARNVSIYIERESLNQYLEQALRCIEPKTIADTQEAVERHIQNGRFETALQLAVEAVERDPCAATYALRGECFARTSDYESARGDLEEALELDPKCSDALNWLGVIARWEGDYDQSLEYFTKAIRQKPKNGLYRYERGMLRFEWDEFQGAWSDFNEAVKDENYWIDAIVYRSACELKQGKIEEACTGLMAVMEKKIEHAKCYFYLGEAMRMSGEVKAAENYYLASISTDKSHIDSEPYLALTDLLIQQDRASDAINVVDRALEYFPEDSSAWTKRGLILYQGNREAAMASFAKAKELDPENEELNGILARIEEIESEETEVAE